MSSRVLLAVVMIVIASRGLAQSIEVASCDHCKPAKRIVIKASCALPDGTVLDHKLIEVDAMMSPDEKRATAERACKPILDAAAAKCEALASQVEGLKHEWRRAALRSYREHQLESEIKQALAAAPAYCK